MHVFKNASIRAQNCSDFWRFAKSTGLGRQVRLLDIERETRMRQIMKNLALAACWLTSTVVAQTRVDLQNQSKNVNLQAQPRTAPLKAGAVLPATCLLADLFFQTTAPAGTNIYGCTSTNNWSLEGGTGGTGGNLTIDLSGTVVGTRAIANFIPGAGILDTFIDTGSQINIQQNVDTGLILSRANHQSGQTLLCASASASATTYTCAMTPTLTSYTTGMVLNWTPDVNGAGGPTTLNVDVLGATAVKLADGATDPVAGDLAGGGMYVIWYDGTVFRLMRSSLVNAQAGTQPACSVTLRGRFWTVFGATGTKDSVTVCAKDATNAYAWRTIY
jgi:hypothetical protein